jgi:hypothetical protein
VERFVADNPWGAFVFALVVVVGAFGAALGSDIALSDFLTVTATAGGLLGVGHSVHRGARKLGKEQ